MFGHFLGDVPDTLIRHVSAPFFQGCLGRREREGRSGPTPPAAPPPWMRGAPPRTPPPLVAPEKGRTFSPPIVSFARPRTPPRSAPLRSPTTASDERSSSRQLPSVPPTGKQQQLDSFIARFHLEPRRAKLLLLKLIQKSSGKCTQRSEHLEATPTPCSSSTSTST